MSEPWERQEKEGTRAFAAFTLYRDMGPQRSVRKVAQELDKSDTLIGRWSARHKWVERAAAWDAEQDRIHREEAQRAAREMAERHAQIATAMMARAAQALRDTDPSKLNPAQLARWVETAAKLERLSRGEPDSITEARTETPPAAPEETLTFLAEHKGE